jgi:predicted transcriptional regulator
MAKRTRAPARRRRKPVRKTSNSRTRNATLSRRRVFAPELLAYARYRFERTDATLADIAVDLGIHKATVRTVAKREGWKRYVSPPLGLPPALQLLAQAEELEAVATSRPPSERERPDGEPVQIAAAESAEVGNGEALPPLVETIARLHRAVLEELAAVETMRARLKREPQSPVDAERTTRTISGLTETLQKLQRLQCALPENGSDNDDMPADIDEYRRDLARRIDAFVESRTNPGDGGASAP